MNTDFPTIEIYFVLAYTTCKITVYERDETFARNVLKEHKVEFLTETPESYLEVDTRVLLSLVKQALPQFLLRETSKALHAITF